MYNANYGDGRKFQTWPSQQLHPQQQQKQQHKLQQQHLPLKQSISRQQQPQKSPERTSEGLWVDVPSEDETLHQMSVFKASSKSHLTPPLDLSEGRRHVESPLDLSVKTRKRCADTTEYGEISRHSIMPEPSIAKRLCTRDYAYPQGHPNFSQESFPPEKPFHEDPINRSKIMHQKQVPQSKYSPVLHKTSSQVSPSSLAPQHYADIQRQHISQQARQTQLSQTQKQRPSSYQMGNIAVPQQMHTSVPKSHMPYENVPSAVKRNPQNMTESVALKGFFEPTHKVTVNAASSQPHSHNQQQQPYPRLPTEQRLTGAGSRMAPSKSNERTDYGEQNRNQSFPNTTAYQRQVSAVNSSYNLQANTGTGIEQIQQEEIMFQRQLQVQKSQREQQMALMTQINREKLLKSQEQQKMAYFMEMQKQTESRLPQTSTQNPYSNRSQHSPYSRQQPSATVSYQDSLRKDRNDFSPARCIRVGQPVPLSDIQQEHSHALEQVHTVQNRPDIIAQQLGAEHSSYTSRNKESSFTSQQAMLNAARMPHTIRYEPTMRYGIHKETNENAANFMIRNDTSNAGLNIHPSVIQRPQGYIPPRIVRGGGRTADSSHRMVMDRGNETQAVPRHDFNTDQTNRFRQELISRDRTVQHKHNDMLSGKEVMKIQQRVAEQRGEASFSGGGQNKNSLKVGQLTDLAEHVQNTFPVSSNKNALRRRSIQESQTRENRVVDYPRPISSESSGRRNSFSKGSGIHNPSEGLSSSKRDIPGANDRQMISLNACQTERSITKGTSGIKKHQSDMDPFSQFLMRELKKTDDDKSVNPFANRSLLEEFDRSANSSPVNKTHNAQEETLDKIETAQKINKMNMKENPKAVSSANIPSSDDSSYTVPLQIAIPGHKISTTVSSSASTTTTTSVLSSATTSRSSVSSGGKSENNTYKNLKHMSRKHMILSAFRQEEEDLKNTTNTVNIDQNEKVPMESAKYAARKSEKEINQHGYPTSPKMPILSPQERNRNTPLVSPAVGDPPNLEDSSRSCLSSGDSSKKEINSLEEHLHRLISDAVKGSKNDRESVYETVRRELSSQPQGKVFLSRQLSQNKNIPVANVAPIVHGKAVSDALEGQEKNSACKTEDELDEEDAKMADIVTRSLFGDQALLLKKENENVKSSEIRVKQEIENEKSDSNLSFPGSSAEALFDENSNSKRMSPGLKKLMLYRHRDNSANSNDNSNQSYSKSEKSKVWSSIVKKEPVPENDVGVKSPKGKGRNVFGAFSEIVAQESEKKSEGSGNTDAERFLGGKKDNSLCWSECQDVEQENIHMVFNTDYDGDDEQARENQIQRKARHSNTKQQADRLIKKARHRRNSKQEGDVRSRHALHVKRKSNKGFVDFMPQVLPRRTRSKSSASTTHRRKAKTGSPHKHRRRSLSHEIKSGNTPQKSRQRRASSLDRETKSRLSKLKTKQICFSDNEIGPVKSLKHSLDNNTVDSDATWHNEDESTDEDYFQNYEDEFKGLVRKNDTGLEFKKASAAKKKKGFHFKQKYIFQRKRRVNKGRGRGLDTANRFGARLDAIYSFHEESQDLGQYHSTSDDLSSVANIPAPADLKRVTVGKDSGQTVLHRAARMGLEEVVLYCLATGSVDVNARDNAGYTALHECALRGRVQIGKHLLTFGADVNCCSTDGIRPIHDAVENDHLEMLRLLLSYGADPTLSTYAGRPLVKIARSERMLKFIQRYNCDINGYASEEEERPWLFRKSSPALENLTASGCAIFDSLPSDPEDESQDLCSFSSKPMFLTRRLTLDPNKRVEDFLLLGDVLDGYNMTRSEFFTHGTSAGVRHLIKQIPKSTLLDAHLDSIYYEGFVSQDENKTVEAIRKVDSTQLIAKLEKNCSFSAKRPKF